MCHGTLKVICSIQFVVAAQAINLSCVLWRSLTNKRYRKQISRYSQRLPLIFPGKGLRHQASFSLVSWIGLTAKSPL